MRIFTLLLVSVWARVAHAQPPAAPTNALQEQIKAVVDAAEPSVVALIISQHPKHGTPPLARPWELGDYPVTNRTERRPFRGTPERDKLDLTDFRNAADHTLGTAVVLDATTGLLLTTAHLLDGARKVYVRIPGGEGSYADIHAADFRSDLAVLKLRSNTRKLRSITWGDVRTHSDAQGRPPTVTRGQWVVSLAHPFATGVNDGQASASWGIISNVARKGPITVGGEEQGPGYLSQHSSLILTDARLNFGCSGGALLNLAGEFIGLTTATAGLAGSESAGGYVIPMDPIYRGIVTVLQRGEEVEYGFLGVSPGTMAFDRGRTALTLRSVTAHSAAAQVGIQQHDMIAAVNGRGIKDESDLFYLVGGALAGNEVSLTILSGGQSRVVKPRLGKAQHPYPYIASVRSPSYYGLRVDYSSVMVQPMIGPWARMAPLNLEGVMIREIEPNSPAERVFKDLPVQQGRWLITKANGVPTLTPKEFAQAVGKKSLITLTIVNAASPGSEPRTVTLP